MAMVTGNCPAQRPLLSPAFHSQSLLTTVGLLACTGLVCVHGQRQPHYDECWWEVNQVIQFDNCDNDRIYRSHTQTVAGQQSPQLAPFEPGR